MPASSIDNSLALTFYQTAIDYGSGGCVFLSGIRDSCIGQISSGNFGVLSSLTVNGKTVQYQNPYSVFDVLKSTQLAIKYWNDGGPITSEVPDFRFLAY